jgi:transcriptional regulator with XRE-family HTH domain
MSLEPAEIGARIREARLRKGWTQLQLALEAGVSPSTVTRWERGGLPPMRELIRISDVLGVPAEELVEQSADGDGTTARLAQLEARVEEALVVLQEVRSAVLAQGGSPRAARQGTSRARPKR